MRKKLQDEVERKKAEEIKKREDKVAREARQESEHEFFKKEHAYLKTI